MNDLKLYFVWPNQRNRQSTRLIFSGIIMVIKFTRETVWSGVDQRWWDWGIYIMRCRKVVFWEIIDWDCLCWQWLRKSSQWENQQCCWNESHGKVVRNRSPHQYGYCYQMLECQNVEIMTVLFRMVLLWITLFARAYVDSLQSCVWSIGWGIGGVIGFQYHSLCIRDTVHTVVHTVMIDQYNISIYFYSTRLYCIIFSMMERTF